MIAPSRKELVTRLAERLVGECGVSDSPKYVGEWEPLYDDLRRQFEGAYRVFELEFDHSVATLLEEVRRGSEDVESAQADFIRACDVHLETLESRVGKAAMDRRRESSERKDDAARLRAERPGLLRKLRRARVALTGGEDVAVADWPGLASKILFWSALTVFMGIEYLVGFELFDWISNPNTALGLSAIVVIAFTAGTYFAVHRFRRLSGHREALIRFRQTFPDGHPDGFVVDMLPSAERHVAWVLGGLLATFALILLIGRIWIATTSDLGFGGVASAIGLLFCFVGYGALEYYLAHPNSQHQVEDLKSLERRLEENDSRLREAMDPAPAEKRYREATDQATLEYQNAVDADYRRYSEMSSVEQKRRELSDALYGYHLAWETFQSGLADGCRQLVERVSIHFSLRSEDIAPPQDDVVDAFGRSVRRRYEDTALLEECRRPVGMTRLERPRVDLDKLKTDIEMRVSMTPEMSDPARMAATAGRTASPSVGTTGARG